MQRTPPDQTPRPCWYAGPPFVGQLFQECVARAGGEAPALLDPGARNTLQAVAERIASGLRASSHPVVLVAHGLAVPAVLRAAALAPGPMLAGVVLSNGPITRLDPITRAWQRLPGARVGLHPQLFVRWLASSAGLRRAVCNPYIMDRDTVDAICSPLVATRADRTAVITYVRSLDPLPPFTRPAVPTMLAWGDDDPLYPLAEADAADVLLGGGHLRAIPGGRFVHPEERPWALADLVTSFCSGLSSSASTPGPARPV